MATDQPGVFHNLAVPLTRFIGREREIALLRQMLAGDSARLLTLTGVGGTGKTRLALEVARTFTVGESDAVFPDGIYWVELAPLVDPELVLQTVAAALGLREAAGRQPQEALINALRSRRALLILDNCEHLAEACAVLAHRLLPACSGLVVFTTSRAPLHADGEVTFSVLPLETVNVDSTMPAANVVQSEAVQLFVDRASMVLPAYTLNNHNADVIRRICQRVDGLPLAIELAASWIRVLSVRDIADHIDRGLDFFATSNVTIASRHRSMRLLLDSSWQQLSAEQQQVFAALAVFRGSFSREAAEAVAGASLSSLAALVENSLMQRLPDASNATRYQLHQLVHQYAFDRLEDYADDSATRVRQQHLSHFLALAEAAEQTWDTEEELVWLERLRTEKDNLRTAMRWAIETTRTEDALRLSAALFTFWNYTAPLSEYSEALERSLSLPWDHESPTSARARAKALNVAGYASVITPDFHSALRYFEEGLALYTNLEDSRGITWSLRGCGYAILLAGDPQTARPYVEQSLALCRQTEDEWGEAWSIFDLGGLAFAAGEVDRALPLIEEALQRFLRFGIAFGAYRARVLLGDIHRRQGHWANALACYGQVFRQREPMPFNQFGADLLEGLAEVATALRRPDIAARLFGAGQNWRRSFGQARYYFREADYQSSLRSACEQLASEDWTAGYDGGSGLSSEQAIAEARLAARELMSLSVRPYPAGVTEREVAVLRLVVLGLSNQEIADRLVVSPRTVHAHLRSIFGKLDVNTRTAAAHEAVRLGLA